MLTFLEVNGAATEASAIESEMPEKMKFSENIHIMEIEAILTKTDVGCCANLPGPASILCFSSRRRLTSVGSFQCSTVIAAVSTHDHLPSAFQIQIHVKT